MSGSARMPAAALIDLFVDDVDQALSVIAELAELIPTEHVNVLSLGPPLRLQVPATALVHVMNSTSYNRIRVLQWPFSHSVEPNRKP